MSTLFEIILERLQNFFTPETLGTQLVDFSINFVVALIAFGAFYVGWIVVRFLLKKFLPKSRFDKTSQAFATTILQYTILLLGLVNALSIMGVDTAGLLASLGIVGITIGFAARDAFSNLISGILIYLDRPFVIGDLVEVGENYGRVEQITLRSTRIITSDGKMLAVPNAEIINKTVTSYTNFPHLRLDVAVTIGVEEDIEQVRQFLCGIVNHDPDYLKEPPPRVVITQLNDYNVAVELQAWIRDERTHVEKRFELREKIFNTLHEKQIDMPFETIKLTPLNIRLDQNKSAETINE
ncbi:mechanosensitive ion channel family protein [Candidatus Leptofilum sp.]|uniref:mechanosensitive ion channel family protein n=1 Tax=Candidatus Leptofilum sp. TaxID=3241576 RepID=UPI003B59A456